MTLTIELIGAVSENGGYGLKNALPWNIMSELAHFKKLTNGHTIVMGTNTFNSIGKVLSNRKTIIMSRSGREGTYKTPQSVLSNASIEPDSKLFIIGGVGVYYSWADTGLIDKYHISLINGSYKHDKKCLFLSNIIDKEQYRAKTPHPDGWTYYEYNKLKGGNE